MKSEGRAGRLDFVVPVSFEKETGTTINKHITHITPGLR